MTTYPTIPAEHLAVGHCIIWNGEGGSVEDVTDQPDDESVYVEICFDPAHCDEPFTIPYGTAIRLLHQSQFDRWKARQDAAAAKLDATMEALKQPVGRAA